LAKKSVVHGCPDGDALRPGGKDTPNVLKHANLHCRRPKLSSQVDHRLDDLGTRYRRTRLYWIAQLAAYSMIESPEKNRIMQELLDNI
jgi:hypothetical protein